MGWNTAKAGNLKEVLEIQKEKEQMLKEFEIVDKLLDICYHWEDFTTSDLQGAIQAQVHMAMNYKERG